MADEQIYLRLEGEDAFAATRSLADELLKWTVCSRRADLDRHKPDDPHNTMLLRLRSWENPVSWIDPQPSNQPISCPRPQTVRAL
jgi:hypothetical protein